MENRKEQLRQHREEELRTVAARVDGGGGFGALWFLDAHEPNETQKAALTAIEERVAELLHTEARALVGPTAEICCIRDRDGNRLRAYDQTSGTGVQVAVQNGTAALHFDHLASSSTSMDAGEALMFPLHAASRLPASEWRVSLSWKTEPASSGGE